jgi:hypothetical protein
MHASTQEKLNAFRFSLRKLESTLGRPPSEQRAANVSAQPQRQAITPPSGADTFAPLGVPSARFAPPPRQPKPTAAAIAPATHGASFSSSSSSSSTGFALPMGLRKIHAQQPPLASTPSPATAPATAPTTAPTSAPAPAPATELAELKRWQEQSERLLAAMRRDVSTLQIELASLTRKVDAMAAEAVKVVAEPSPPPAIFEPSEAMKERAAQLINMARPFMISTATMDRMYDVDEGERSFAAAVASSSSSSGDDAETEAEPEPKVSERPVSELTRADGAAVQAEGAAVQAEGAAVQAEGAAVQAEGTPIAGVASVGAAVPSPLCMITSDLASAFDLPRVCSKEDLTNAVVMFGEERLMRSSVTFLKSLCLRADGLSYTSPKQRTVQAIMQWARDHQERHTSAHLPEEGVQQWKAHERADASDSGGIGPVGAASSEGVQQPQSTPEQQQEEPQPQPGQQQEEPQPQPEERGEQPGDEQPGDEQPEVVDEEQPEVVNEEQPEVVDEEQPEVVDEEHEVWQ